MKQLLENNTNINTKDENEQTALYRVAAQSNQSIVKLLLDFNANVNIENLNRQTAI